MDPCWRVAQSLMFFFRFDKYLIEIWQRFETWSRLWSLVFKIGPQGWSSRLVVKAGCQYWSSRLVIKAGRQLWSSRLVIKVDRQGWSSRLVVKVGRQSWSSRLLSRLLSRFLSKLLSLHYPAHLEGQFSYDNMTKSPIWIFYCQVFLTRLFYSK